MRRYWQVGFQLLFVFLLTRLISRPLPLEFSRPMSAALAFWTGGVAFLISRTGISALRSDHPIRNLQSNLLAERSTMIRALKVAIAAGVAIALLGWAKSMIPHVTTYWADPYLADADRWIFGEDPWRLFRIDFLERAYVVAYLAWFGIVFGTLGVLAFTRRDHSRLISSFLSLVVFVGTVGQYVLPSAGPMFYGRLGFGNRFEPLVATNQPMFNEVGDYLWRHYLSGAPDLGTGISAMPSMHVALAIWVAFAAYALWKPLVVPAVIYAILVWAASIASGWHYAIDGIVSLALVTCVHAVVAARTLIAADSSGSEGIGTNPIRA